MIDVMPMILEAAGIPVPEMVDGIEQAPIEGTRFACTFDKANAKAPSRLGRTSRRAAASSSTPGPWWACRKAIRRPCSTRPTRSRRRSSRGAEPRACC
jgi:arylsulfatase A-like enzyme